MKRLVIGLAALIVLSVDDRDEAEVVPYRISVSGEIGVLSGSDALGLEGGQLSYEAILDANASPSSSFPVYDPWPTVGGHATEYEITSEEITLEGTALDGTYPLAINPSLTNRLRIYDMFNPGRNDRLFFIRSASQFPLDGNGSIQTVGSHPYLDSETHDFLTGPVPTSLPVLFGTDDVPGVLCRFQGEENGDSTLYDLVDISVTTSSGPGNAIPEPSAFVLAAAGLLGSTLFVGRRRRR